MVTKLTLQQVIDIVRTAPEQSLFDWKKDLCTDKAPDKRCEFVKDISAIANATTRMPGYIFYGVNPKLPDPIVGIKNHLDDADFQQIVNTKVKPEIDFIYYEIIGHNKTIGIIQVLPSSKKPHIISRDYGKLREGQILIRQGSSTRGVHLDDLIEIFYGKNSPYLTQYLTMMSKQDSIANQINAITNYLRESRSYEQDLKKQMLIAVGLLPPDA